MVWMPGRQPPVAVRWGMWCEIAGVATVGDDKSFPLTTGPPTEQQPLGAHPYWDAVKHRPEIDLPLAASGSGSSGRAGTTRSCRSSTSRSRRHPRPRVRGTGPSPTLSPLRTRTAPAPSWTSRARPTDRTSGSQARSPRDPTLTVRDDATHPDRGRGQHALLGGCRARPRGIRGVLHRRHPHRPGVRRVLV